MSANISDPDRSGQVIPGDGITQGHFDADLGRCIEELTELTRIAEEWRAQAGAFKKELRLSKHSFGVLEAELKQLKRQSTELSALADKRRVQGETSRSELRRVRGQLERAQSDANAWRARAAALETQIAEILGSRSWRITRPMRWMRSVWGRGRAAG